MCIRDRERSVYSVNLSNFFSQLSIFPAYSLIYVHTEITACDVTRLTIITVILLSVILLLLLLLLSRCLRRQIFNKTNEDKVKTIITRSEFQNVYRLMLKLPGIGTSLGTDKLTFVTSL